MRTAGIWFDTLGTDARRIAAENPGVSDAPGRAGARCHVRAAGSSSTSTACAWSSIAAVGETIDGAIVWLPERRTALISNLFGPLFPHFPNLNTLRGDRYRFVEPYLESVRTVRALRPEILITGRHDPIVGEDLIDASLARLHGAVDYVHQKALEGFNAGIDVWTLMEEIRLPPELRVGQGYGKVSWAVRTLWESYVGWFKLQSTTELYPDSADRALAELAEAAGRRGHARAGRRPRWPAATPPLAIRLGETVSAAEPGSPRAGAVLVGAHRLLLEQGGDTSFWENGWLRGATRALGESLTDGPLPRRHHRHGH